MSEAGEQFLVFSYDSLEGANAAREALAKAGLPLQASAVSVRQDEAGPVEGNFLIGNGRTFQGAEPGPALTGPNVPYEQNFAQVKNRGVYLLEVRTPVARRSEIEAVLRTSGGVDASAVSDAAVQGRIR